ncbi:hypothetical protein HN873_042687 [Arachis hypogaea]
MVVNERPTKRMKRRVTADLHDFLTFPSAAGASLDSPFRNCVQRFLADHGRITFPPSLFPALMTWQILFRVGDLVEGPDLSPAVVTLDIVEEDVTRSRSSVYCDQCRVVGWSGHPVCRKRYHFIIRDIISLSGLPVNPLSLTKDLVPDVKILSNYLNQGANHVTSTLLWMILRIGCINKSTITPISCMVLSTPMVMVTCLLSMEEKVAQSFSLDLILWDFGIDCVLQFLLGRLV